MADLMSDPRISIVVEWENALLSEGGRPAAMLRTVGRQAVELAAKPDAHPFLAGGWPWCELLIVFDPARSDSDDLAALLEHCLAEAEDVLRCRLLSVSDSGYYSKKNHGARAAAGQIVAFLDSDVVPEPDWLEQILAALKDPGIQVVAGNTYIEPVGLIGKTFALTWFFPLRNEEGALQRARSLFANNLAIRREVCERYPFPEIWGSSRGACIVLAAQLALADVPVFHNPRARVAHPAPNGFAHVSMRALAQGRDRVLRERIYGSRMSASWLASGYRLLRHWAGSAWTICTGFARVGLNPLLIPAAVAVAAYYYLLYWSGETMLQLRISAIREIRI